MALNLASLNQRYNYLLNLINQITSGLIPVPSTSPLSVILSNGNNAGTNDIDMNGNDILNVSTLTTTGNMTLDPTGSLIVNGDMDVNGTSTFERPLVMNDTTSSANRTITSSFFNFYNSGVAGTLTQNGTLYNQNGSMYLQNQTNSGNINFVLNDAGGVQNTPFQLLSSGNLSNRPLTISANNNLIMPAGTGSITQSVTSGDTSTKNTLKLSQFVVNSNNATGGATAFEFYDSINGKGLFLLPNSGNSSLGDTNRQNDCVLSSRSTQNNNAITISNWNTNMRNGLRVFTNSINESGLTLQSGQNTTNDWTEFAMNYNRVTNTTITTFNNVINFNPTSPSVTPPLRRQLINLGTLQFLDINANGGTNGTSTSIIALDGVAVDGINGMVYDSSLNGGSHIFKCNGIAGAKLTPFYLNTSITSVSNTFVIRNSTTTNNRLDIITDGSAKSTMRARTSTASTNAQIEINCDTVDGGGTISTNNVLNIFPTSLTMKRPIQFSYLTTPNARTQLGFITGPTAITTTSVASLASERNYSSFTIDTAGTYQINVLISMAGGANHTLTECRWCLDGTSATFPSTSTPTKYTPSITGFVGGSLSSTYISYLNINFCVLATASNIFYINYVLNYSGGSNTVIGAVFSYTRIG